MHFATSDVAYMTTTTENKFYVYVLFCCNKRLYVGFTNNIRRRLQQHARGEVASTKNRRPLRLIHYEYFVSEADAKAREIFLKSGYGHKQLKQILKNTFSDNF